MKPIQFTAERIKQLCDKQGVSINKMLIESGAGARTYHNMVAGSYPSTDKAEKIAEYFGCSVDYLLGRTDVPEVNRGDIVKKTEVKFAAEMPVSVPPKVIKKKRHT